MYLDACFAPLPSPAPQKFTLPEATPQSCQNHFSEQTAGLDFERLAHLSQARERISVYQGCIAAGGFHTAAVRTNGLVEADGTVVAVGLNNGGGARDSGWSGITAVATSGKHTVGLRADGAVLAVGNNKYGQCNTRSWAGVVAVAAGGKYTLGLRADGAIIAAGKITDSMSVLNSWRNIVAISVDGNNIVGLMPDGTVKFATDVVLYGLDKVKGWSGIVAVSTAARHIVGLKASGTVVAAGMKKDGCNTENWWDIGPNRYRW